LIIFLLNKHYFIRPYTAPPYRITETLVSEWALIVEKWGNSTIEMRWMAAEYSRSQDSIAFFLAGVWDALWDEIR